MTDSFPRATLSIRAKAASVLVLIALGAAIPGLAQRAERLSQVKKVYVESLGADNGATLARIKLVHRLEKSHGIRVVEDPADADALLKGTARIWSVGQVSLSPRSRSKQPLLEGFLSIELVGSKNQTLWSYLVTPSKFPWGGVENDLARQITNRLLGALHDGNQAEPTTSDQSANNRSILKGAGATFPAPLYARWFELFREDHSNIQLSYDPVGSAEGIRRLKDDEIDFAGSELPLSSEDEARKPRIKQFPVALGAVVPIYHVAGLHRDLNFTPETLSAIYLGTINRWNDPALKKINHGAPLPDAPITVVHRSDGSGTTFVWSEFLSKVSSSWKSKVGAGDTVLWPVGVGAEHNEGVAASVQRTPNSIGYVELIYAIQHQLSFGGVRNKAGQFIKADISSVTTASRASISEDSGFRVSITDSPEKDAYPIATYTWFLLPDRISDNDKKSALLELLRWMLTSGQKSCSALGYAPLPLDVARNALQSIGQTP